MKISKHFFKKLSIIILVLTVISFWAEQTYLYYDGGYYEDESCNVTNIKLNGDLYTYISSADKDEFGNILWDEVSSEDIVNAIEDAESDDNIKAIVIEIDSFGGGLVAGEEVSNALRRTTKPTVALIREYGLSAAYWSATGADIIFASASSDVGSIGITSSYLDNTKKNEKDGITFVQLTTGKYKNMLNPDKVLTDEERNLIERDLNIIYENFIKAVADNRNLEIEKVKLLADGSSMPGQMALENGLIDKIGGKYEVEEYLKELISNNIVLCK